MTQIFYVNPSTGNDANLGSQAAPFKTLSQAVKKATSGNIIQLNPGTYSTAIGEVFPLIIPAGVTVVGNETNKGKGIIIQGGGLWTGKNIGVRLENNAQLRGVTITNSSGIGVLIDSPTSTVMNNTFTQCQREGIFATNITKVLINNNVFSANKSSGILLERNAKGEIRSNRIELTGYGIYIKDNAAPLITDNQLVSNGSGVIIDGNARPVLRKNIIEKNNNDGLRLLSNANPDLGRPQDGGGNIIRNNGQFDLQNNTALEILSVGNQLNPVKVKGTVNFAANLFPSPKIPKPTTTVTPTPIQTNSAARFPDINGHWAQGFIESLVNQGIISGFPDGSFQPDAKVTRAQYAAIIAKTFQFSGKKEKLVFVDVADGFWAKSAIEQAQIMGFISGFPDRTFRPNQNLTRVQAIVSLVSGLGMSEDNPNLLKLYSDRAQIPSYATVAIATATSKQIIVNYPQVNQLQPLRDITRAEISALIYQALVATNKAPAINSDYIVKPDTSQRLYNDLSGQWAEVFIHALAQAGIIQGFPDGTFKPEANMTRAQFAALLNQTFDLDSLPAKNADAKFTDIPDNFWALNAIKKAYRAGFLSGFPDNTFRPNDNIQRVQVIVSLVNGLGLSGGDIKVLEYYSDRADIPNYALDEVATATKNGLIVNYPNLKQINPNRPATRGEVAASLYQIMVNSGKLNAINSPYIVRV